MRFIPVLLLALISSFAHPVCFNIEDPSARKICRDKEMALDSRIFRTHPSRRGGPLRSVNLNDIEVREIQAAAVGVYSDAVINISGSTVGCHCEDGPKCTGEVWLMASTAGGVKDLKLSKIDGHWKVGPIQNWWLKYFEFQAAHPHSQRDIDYFKEEAELKTRFPECSNI
jgi:hypothetical protein